MNVITAIMGAAMANMIKCLRIRARSRPSWSKNETRPNAAGAFENKNSSSLK
jgi:hypothetical protein